MDALTQAIAQLERAVDGLEVQVAVIASVRGLAGGFHQERPHGDYLRHLAAGTLGDQAELPIGDGSVVPAQPVDSSGHQAARTDPGSTRVSKKPSRPGCVSM